MNAEILVIILFGLWMMVTSAVIDKMWRRLNDIDQYKCKTVKPEPVNTEKSIEYILDRLTRLERKVAMIQNPPKFKIGDTVNVYGIVWDDRQIHSWPSDKIEASGIVASVRDHMDCGTMLWSYGVVIGDKNISYEEKFLTNKNV